MRLLGELAGERTLVEGDAHDDANPALLRDVEQFRGGFLFKEVVDDLDAVHPAAAHQVDDAVLVVFRRGDADEADLALALQLAENLEWRWVAVPGARPGVELQQVDFVDAEAGEALGQVGAEVGLGVAVRGAVVGRGGPGAGGRRGLGGDEDLLRPAGGGALIPKSIDK